MVPVIGQVLNRYRIWLAVNVVLLLVYLIFDYQLSPYWLDGEISDDGPLMIGRGLILIPLLILPLLINLVWFGVVIWKKDRYGFWVWFLTGVVWFCVYLFAHFVRPNP